MLSRFVIMQPTLVRDPFHRPGWMYERKEDGWRMLAFKDGSHVRLVSRQGVDHTARFSAIASAVGKLPTRTLILDGELCVFDSQLVSQFHLIGDERPKELTTPPVFISFDLLQLGTRDLRARALSFRRPMLEDAVAGSKFIFPALRLDDDGVWQRGRRSSAEVRKVSWRRMKRVRYVGGQTRSLLKVKIRHEARFAVIGLDVPLAGSRSLLLARPRNDLSEEFNPFPCQFGAEGSHSGNVAPRTRIAPHEGMRVAHRRHNRWNRFGRLFGRPGGGCPPGHDQVDIETDQFGREVRESLGATIRRPIFDHQISPFDVAPVPEPPAQGVEIGNVPCGGYRFENPDAINLPRRLRLGERRGEECERTRDEYTSPNHSIT